MIMIVVVMLMKMISFSLTFLKFSPMSVYNP